MKNEMSESVTREVTSPLSDDGFVDTVGATSVIPVSESWLNKARCTGDGPPFYKIGARVFYSKRELLEWATGHRRLSTSAYQAA